MLSLCFLVLFFKRKVSKESDDLKTLRWLFYRTINAYRATAITAIFAHHRTKSSNSSALKNAFGILIFRQKNKGFFGG